ncbi:hypothetical protein P785_0155 [Enterococcus faecalis KS19]|nr:hypothetical protein P785_0155 [Enterococcus faecalis KS19]
MPFHCWYRLIIVEKEDKYNFSFSPQKRNSLKKAKKNK